MSTSSSSVSSATPDTIASSEASGLRQPSHGGDTTLADGQTQLQRPQPEEPRSGETSLSAAGQPSPPPRLPRALFVGQEGRSPGDDHDDSTHATSSSLPASNEAITSFSHSPQLAVAGEEKPSAPPSEADPPADMSGISFSNALPDERAPHGSQRPTATPGAPSPSPNVLESSDHTGVTSGSGSALRSSSHRSPPPPPLQPEHLASGMLPLPTDESGGSNTPAFVEGEARGGKPGSPLSDGSGGDHDRLAGPMTGPASALQDSETLDSGTKSALDPADSRLLGGQSPPFPPEAITHTATASKRTSPAPSPTSQAQSSDTRSRTGSDPSKPQEATGNASPEEATRWSPATPDNVPSTEKKDDAAHKETADDHSAPALLPRLVATAVGAETDPTQMARLDRPDAAAEGLLPPGSDSKRDPPGVDEAVGPTSSLAQKASLTGDPVAASPGEHDAEAGGPGLDHRNSQTDPQVPSAHSTQPPSKVTSRRAVASSSAESEASSSTGGSTAPSTDHGAPLPTPVHSTPSTAARVSVFSSTEEVPPSMTRRGKLSLNAVATPVGLTASSTSSPQPDTAAATVAAEVLPQLSTVPSPSVSPLSRQARKAAEEEGRRIGTAALAAHRSPHRLRTEGADSSNSDVAALLHLSSQGSTDRSPPQNASTRREAAPDGHGGVAAPDQGRRMTDSWQGSTPSQASERRDSAEEERGGTAAAAHREGSGYPQGHLPLFEESDSASSPPSSAPSSSSSSSSSEASEASEEVESDTPAASPLDGQADTLSAAAEEKGQSGSGLGRSPASEGRSGSVSMPFCDPPDTPVRQYPSNSDGSSDSRTDTSPKDHPKRGQSADKSDSTPIPRVDESARRQCALSGSVLTLNSAHESFVPVPRASTTPSEAPLAAAATTGVLSPVSAKGVPPALGGGFAPLKQAVFAAQDPLRGARQPEGSSRADPHRSSSGDRSPDRVTVESGGGGQGRDDSSGSYYYYSSYDYYPSNEEGEETDSYYDVSDASTQADGVAAESLSPSGARAGQQPPSAPVFSAREAHNYRGGPSPEDSLDRVAPRRMMGHEALGDTAHVRRARKQRHHRRATLGAGPRPNAADAAELEEDEASAPLRRSRTGHDLPALTSEAGETAADPAHQGAGGRRATFHSEELTPPSPSAAKSRRRSSSTIPSADAEGSRMVYRRASVAPSVPSAVYSAVEELYPEEPGSTHTRPSASVSHSVRQPRRNSASALLSDRLQAMAAGATGAPSEESPSHQEGQPLDGNDQAVAETTIADNPVDTKATSSTSNPLAHSTDVRRSAPASQGPGTSSSAARPLTFSSPGTAASSALLSPSTSISTASLKAGSANAETAGSRHHRSHSRSHSREAQSRSTRSSGGRRRRWRKESSVKETMPPPPALTLPQDTSSSALHLSTLDGGRVTTTTANDLPTPVDAEGLDVQPEALPTTQVGTLPESDHVSVDAEEQPQMSLGDASSKELLKEEMEEKEEEEAPLPVLHALLYEEPAVEAIPYLYAEESQEAIPYLYAEESCEAIPPLQAWEAQPPWPVLSEEAGAKQPLSLAALLPPQPPRSYCYVQVDALSRLRALLCRQSLATEGALGRGAPSKTFRLALYGYGEDQPKTTHVAHDATSREVLLHAGSSFTVPASVHALARRRRHPESWCDVLCVGDKAIVQSTFPFLVVKLECLRVREVEPEAFAMGAPSLSAGQEPAANVLQEEHSTTLSVSASSASSAASAPHASSNDASTEVPNSQTEVSAPQSTPAVGGGAESALAQDPSERPPCTTALEAVWTPVAVSQALPSAAVLATATSAGTAPLQKAAQSNASLCLPLCATHELCRQTQGPLGTDPHRLREQLLVNAGSETERVCLATALRAVMDPSLTASVGEPAFPCLVACAEGEPLYMPGMEVPKGASSATPAAAGTMKSSAISIAIAQFEAAAAAAQRPSQAKDGFPLTSLHPNGGSQRPTKPPIVMWNTMPRARTAAGASGGSLGGVALPLPPRPTGCALALHVTVVVLERLPLYEGGAASTVRGGVPQPHVALTVSGGAEGGRLGGTTVPPSALWGQRTGEDVPWAATSESTQAPVVRLDYRLHTYLTSGHKGSTLLLTLHPATNEALVLGQVYFNPFAQREKELPSAAAATQEAHATWLPLYAKGSRSEGSTEAALVRVGWVFCEYEATFTFDEAAMRGRASASLVTRLSDALVLRSRQQQQQLSQREQVWPLAAGSHAAPDGTMVMDVTIVAANGLCREEGNDTLCNAFCQLEALLVNPPAEDAYATEARELPTREDQFRGTPQRQRQQQQGERGGNRRSPVFVESPTSVLPSAVSGTPRHQPRLIHANTPRNAYRRPLSPSQQTPEDDVGTTGARREAYETLAGPFLTDTVCGSNFPEWRETFRLDAATVSRLMLRVCHRAGAGNAGTSPIGTTTLTCTTLTNMWLAGQGCVWLPLYGSVATATTARYARGHHSHGSSLADAMTMSSVLIQWRHADEEQMPFRSPPHVSLMDRYPCTTRIDTTDTPALSFRQQGREEDISSLHQRVPRVSVAAEENSANSEKGVPVPLGGTEIAPNLLATLCAATEGAAISDDASLAQASSHMWLKLHGTQIVWPWLAQLSTTALLEDPGQGSLTLSLTLHDYGEEVGVASWRLVPSQPLTFSHAGTAPTVAALARHAGGSRNRRCAGPSEGLPNADGNFILEAQGPTSVCVPLRRRTYTAGAQSLWWRVQWTSAAADRVVELAQGHWLPTTLIDVASVPSPFFTAGASLVALWPVEVPWQAPGWSSTQEKGFTGSQYPMPVQEYAGVSMMHHVEKGFLTFQHACFPHLVTCLSPSPLSLMRPSALPVRWRWPEVGTEAHVAIRLVEWVLLPHASCDDQETAFNAADVEGFARQEERLRETIGISLVERDAMAVPSEPLTPQALVSQASCSERHGAAEWFSAGISSTVGPQTAAARTTSAVTTAAGTSVATARTASVHHGGASPVVSLHGLWSPRLFDWFTRSAPDLEVLLIDPNPENSDARGGSGTIDGYSAGAAAVVGTLRLPALSPFTHTRGSVWLPIEGGTSAAAAVAEEEPPRLVRGYARVEYQHNFVDADGMNVESEGERVSSVVSQPQDERNCQIPGVLMLHVVSARLRSSNSGADGAESLPLALEEERNATNAGGATVLVGYGSHTMTIPVPSSTEGDEGSAEAAVIAFPIGEGDTLVRLQLRDGMEGAEPILSTSTELSVCAMAQLSVADSLHAMQTAMAGAASDGTALLEPTPLCERWLPLVCRCNADAGSATVMATGELLVRWSMWPAVRVSVVPACVTAYSLWHGGSMQVMAVADEEDEDVPNEVGSAVGEGEDGMPATEDSAPQRAAMTQAWNAFVSEQKQAAAHLSQVRRGAPNATPFLVLSHLVWELPAETKEAWVTGAQVAKVWVEVASTTSGRVRGSSTLCVGGEDEVVDQTDMRDLTEALVWEKDRLLFPLPTERQRACTSAAGMVEAVCETLEIRIFGTRSDIVTDADATPVCLAVGQASIEHHRHHGDRDATPCTPHAAAEGLESFEEINEKACGAPLHELCQDGGDAEECSLRVQPQFWAAPLSRVHSSGNSLAGDAPVGRLTWFTQELYHPFPTPVSTATNKPPALAGATEENAVTPVIGDSVRSEKSTTTTAVLLLSLTVEDVALREGGGGTLAHRLAARAIPIPPTVHQVSMHVVTPVTRQRKSPIGADMAIANHARRLEGAAGPTVGRQHARPSYASQQEVYDSCRGADGAWETIPLAKRVHAGVRNVPSHGSVPYPASWHGDACVFDTTTIAMSLVAHSSLSDVPAPVANPIPSPPAHPQPAGADEGSMPMHKVDALHPTHGIATFRVDAQAFSSAGGVVQQKLTIHDAATGSWLGEAQLSLRLLAYLPGPLRVRGATATATTTTTNDTPPFLPATVCSTAPLSSHFFFSTDVSVAAWRCVGPVGGSVTALQTALETCRRMQEEAAVAQARHVPLGARERNALENATACLEGFLERSARRDGKRHQCDQLQEHQRKDGGIDRVALQLEVITENGVCAGRSTAFHALDAASFIQRTVGGGIGDMGVRGQRPLVETAVTASPHVNPTSATADNAEDGRRVELVFRLAALSLSPPPPHNEEANPASGAAELGRGVYQWTLSDDREMIESLPEQHHVAWIPIHAATPRSQATSVAHPSRDDPVASVLVRAVAQQRVVHGTYTLTCLRLAPPHTCGAEIFPLRYPSLRITYTFPDGTRRVQHLPLYHPGDAVHGPHGAGALECLDERPPAHGGFWGPMQQVRVPRIGCFGGRIALVELLDFTESPLVSERRQRREVQASKATAEEKSFDAADETYDEEPLDLMTFREHMKRSHAIATVLATHRWTGEDEVALFSPRLTDEREPATAFSAGQPYHKDSSDEERGPRARVSQSPRMRWISLTTGGPRHSRDLYRVLLCVSPFTPSPPPSLSRKEEAAWERQDVLPPQTAPFAITSVQLRVAKPDCPSSASPPICWCSVDAAYCTEKQAEAAASPTTTDTKDSPWVSVVKKATSTTLRLEARESGEKRGVDDSQDAEQGTLHCLTAEWALDNADLPFSSQLLRGVVVMRDADGTELQAEPRLRLTFALTHDEGEGVSPYVVTCTWADVVDASVTSQQTGLGCLTLPVSHHGAVVGEATVHWMVIASPLSTGAGEWRDAKSFLPVFQPSAVAAAADGEHGPPPRLIEGRKEADIIQELHQLARPGLAPDGSRRSPAPLLTEVVKEARQVLRTQVWLDAMVKARRARLKAPRRLARRSWAWSVEALEMEGVRPAREPSPTAPGPLSLAPLTSVTDREAAEASPFVGVPLLAQLSFASPHSRTLSRTGPTTQVKGSPNNNASSDKKNTNAEGPKDEGGMIVGVARAVTQPTERMASCTTREAVKSSPECSASFSPLMWRIPVRDLVKTSTRHTASLSLWQLLSRRGSGNSDDDGSETSEGVVGLLGRAALRGLFSDLRDLSEAAIADLEAAMCARAGEVDDETLLSRLQQALPAPLFRTQWLSMRVPATHNEKRDVAPDALPPSPRVRLVLRAPWAQDPPSQQRLPGERADGDTNSIDVATTLGKAPERTTRASDTTTIAAFLSEAKLKRTVNLGSAGGAGRDRGDENEPQLNLALFICVEDDAPVAATGSSPVTTSFHTRLTPLISQTPPPPPPPPPQLPSHGTETEPTDEASGVAEPQGNPENQPPLAATVPCPVPLPVPLHVDIKKTSEDAEGNGVVTATATYSQVATTPSEERLLLPVKSFFVFEQSGTTNVRLRFYAAACGATPATDAARVSGENGVVIERILGLSECVVRLPAATAPAPTATTITTQIPLTRSEDGGEEASFVLELSLRLYCGEEADDAAAKAAAAITAAHLTEHNRHARKGSVEEGTVSKHSRRARPRGMGAGSCLHDALVRVRVLASPWPALAPLELAVSHVKVLSGHSVEKDEEDEWAEVSGQYFFGFATASVLKGDGGSARCLVDGGLTLMVSPPAPSQVEEIATSVSRHSAVPQPSRRRYVRPHTGSSFLARGVPRTSTRTPHTSAVRTPDLAKRHAPSPPPHPFSRLLQEEEEGHPVHSSTASAIFCPTTRPRISLKVRQQGTALARDDGEADTCYLGHAAGTVQHLGSLTAAVSSQGSTFSVTWLLGGWRAALSPHGDDLPLCEPLPVTADSLRWEWSPDVRCCRVDSHGNPTGPIVRVPLPAPSAPAPYSWALPSPRDAARPSAVTSTASHDPSPLFACSAPMQHDTLLFFFGGLRPCATAVEGTCVGSDVLVFDAARLQWYTMPSPHDPPRSERESQSSLALSETGDGESALAWPTPRFGHSVVRLPSTDHAARPHTSSSFYIMCGGAQSAQQLVPPQDMLWVCELHTEFGCRWQRVSLPSPRHVRATCLTPCFQPRVRFTWTDPTSQARKDGSDDQAWATGVLHITGGSPQRPALLDAMVPPAVASPSLGVHEGNLVEMTGAALRWWLASAGPAGKASPTVAVACVCPRAPFP